MATTWSLSFQKIEQANPAATELLRLCAFLAPDRIPEELIRDGAKHWTHLLQQAATDSLTFNQMLHDLLKYSLIKRLTEENMLTIHRLVQAVQIDTIEPEVQHQWAERVVRAVNSVFPRSPQEEATWPQCLRYLDQAQACDSLIRQHRLIFPEVADLLNRTGLYLADHASYTLAESLYVRALSIREQELGPQHLDTAKSLHNLAELHRHQRRYQQAEMLYLRALTILEQHLGPQHSDTATALNDLAELYRSQGKYEQAEPLLQRALAIFEQQLGPQHTYTAAALHHLADRATAEDAAAESAKSSAYHAQRRYEGGIADYVEVTSTQSSALQAQRAALEARVQRLNAAVSLLRALGGDWRDPAPAQAAAR